MGFDITPLGQRKPPEPETPKLYSDSYKHELVDSNFQPERSLLSMAPGTIRMFEWYRVRQQADEESVPFAPGNLGTYQTYDRIKKTIIKVTDAGRIDFREEEGESTSVHSGYSITSLNPNLNDVMIADIGDGNAGLFTVTAQPRPSEITANKLWTIEFRFLCILTEELYIALNSRVAQELVYDRDSAMNGGGEVISPGDYQVGKEVYGWSNTIAHHLMKTWYWNPEKTIGFQHSDKKWVYDPYLVEFIRAIITPDQGTTFPTINTFSLQYGGMERNYHGTINVWDVLIRGDFNLLGQCSNKASYISTNRLINTRTYGNLRSSKFGWFISTDPEHFEQFKYPYNREGYPIFPYSPEVKFSNYVFSDEFFTGNPIDPFEKMVIRILRDNVVDKRELLEFCKGYFDLDPMAQLYKGPILILLINVSRHLRDPL